MVRHCTSVVQTSQSLQYSIEVEGVGQVGGQDGEERTVQAGTSDPGTCDPGTSDPGTSDQVLMTQVLVTQVLVTQVLVTQVLVTRRVHSMLVG
jgi:hypothetical protein